MICFRVETVELDSERSRIGSEDAKSEPLGLAGSLAVEVWERRDTGLPHKMAATDI